VAYKQDSKDRRKIGRNDEAREHLPGTPAAKLAKFKSGIYPFVGINTREQWMDAK